MSLPAAVPTLNSAQLCQAMAEISELVASCNEPKKLAQGVADQLGKFLPFDHLDVVVFKESTDEVDWQAWGKGGLPFDDLRPDEARTWQIYRDKEPLYVSNWKDDARFPRLKEVAVESGVVLTSVLRVPLATACHRVGTLGIASGFGAGYSAEDIRLLQSIAGGIALAIHNALNLREAQYTQTALQRNNERLQVLLNLTERIASNLDLREVLRTVAANFREVMRASSAIVALVQPSGKYRFFAADIPDSRGWMPEEVLVTLVGLGKEAVDTGKAVIVKEATREHVAPEVYHIVEANGVRGQCLVPLVSHNKGLGVLIISRRTTEAFTEDDTEFLTKAAGPIAIAIENAYAYRQILELKDKLAQEKLYLEEEIRTELGFHQIIGNSPALRQVLEMVETVASSDSTVLLLGETGTGKELIARAIHDHSRRKDRTFVKLNCAAIPTGLVESELFGHEKGAFTGAISQKVGRLELADQGSLFLDEVGDIPIEIQPKLLRALQEREFERLGSTHTRKVNVRLVAATNRNLEQMVAAREFRSDLFYRLNVFPIRIPPLRERPGDIPLLVSYFVQKFAKQMQKKIETIPSSMMNALSAWDWPGNIRELENFVERAIILTRGKVLEAPLAELRKATAVPTSATVVDPGREDIARIVKETLTALDSAASQRHVKQREAIIHALTESKGRVGGEDGAAARMGINRTTLISRMKKLGIDPNSYTRRSQVRNPST